MSESSKSSGRIGGDRVSPAARKLTSEREAQIMELRLRKVPFSKIAQTLGMTKSAASKAYYRALHRVPTRNARDLIIEDIETLERIEARTWQEMGKPGQDSKTVFKGSELLLRVQQRRAKLLGLEAPQRVNVNLLNEGNDEADIDALREPARLDRLTIEERLQLLDLIKKISSRRDDDRNRPK
jgi:hypothetical protein